MDWIGNRVSINGVEHVLRKYRDPDTGEVVEFYLRNGMSKFVPIRFERLIPPPLEPCK